MASFSSPEGSGSVGDLVLIGGLALIAWLIYSTTKGIQDTIGGAGKAAYDAATGTGTAINADVTGTGAAINSDITSFLGSLQGDLQGFASTFNNLGAAPGNILSTGKQDLTSIVGAAAGDVSGAVSQAETSGGNILSTIESDVSGFLNGIINSVSGGGPSAQSTSGGASQAGPTVGNYTMPGTPGVLYPLNINVPSSDPAGALAALAGNVAASFQNSNFSQAAASAPVGTLYTGPASSNTVSPFGGTVPNPINPNQKGYSQNGVWSPYPFN